MKLRLFVGIAAPPEWKSSITQWRGKVQSRFSDSLGRWTSEENLHLTLRFFGSVEETDVPEIGEELQKVAAPTKAFAVSAGDLGCFPNASRPRIVWLGLKGSTENLIELERRIRGATKQIGQPPDDREFHPHLTLARVKEVRRHDRDALAELIRKGSSIEVPKWQIRQIELIRSELRAGGSVYETLATFRFCG